MKTEDKRFRVALVGCGAIAEQGHIPALLKHPRFRLVATCDVRAERSALLAGQAGGVESLTDWRRLLGRKDIDAVVLALHPEVSVDVAIEFLRDGKAVLDEKPMAASLEAGRRLVDAVGATRGIYQIGFVFGYSGFVLGVAPYVALIGRPTLYHVAVYDELLDRANVEHFARIQTALRNSSAVTHEGSHVVDYVRQWSGSEYTRASAVAVKTEADLDGPNLWSTQFAMADGSALTLEIGWLLPALPPLDLTIVGPNGALTMNMASGQGRFSTGGAGAAVSVPPIAQGWDGQLDTFAEAIDRGVSTIAPVQRGWAALVATHACERAAKSGQCVPIVL